MELRSLKPLDAPIFANWESKERPYPWTERQFLDVIRNAREHGLVWEDEKDILGFGVVQIVEHEAYLLNLMVSPDFRKKGYGKQLLEKIEVWCRAQRASHISLDVDEKNSPAVNLYQRRGFTVLQRRAHSYPNGEDALLMKKTL